MLEFYKKALFALIGVLLLSGLIAYLCIDRTFLHLALLPHSQSELPWHAVTETDAGQGGQSSLRLNDSQYSLDMEVLVSNQIEYPSVGLALELEDRNGQPVLVDLSDFSGLSFSVKCSVPNVLTFIVFTFDPDFSDRTNYLTYRAPASYFSCDQNWSQADIDLTRLEMQQWWLDMFHISLSKNDYQLEKVAKFQIGTSHQSPKDLPSRVQISQLVLHGSDWFYLYLLAITLFVIWTAYVVWFFKYHARALTDELKRKILRERPLVAYRQLSMEPKRDKDHDAILRFLTTGYANPDLNLDIVVAQTGISRSKINDILKAELGFTFTGYLNKLRLTEAARLLSEKEEANIAEIAYTVGYKNVSYFNKLFKEEYGCTPKVFKQLYRKMAP